MRFPEGDHLAKELKKLSIIFELVPVEPSRLVILVVRIVVALLRVQELVTRQKHRRAVCQEQQAADILSLTTPQCRDWLREVPISLVTTVPAEIICRAIRIVVAVCFVMAFVVRDLIVQRETVVRVHVVNALVGVKSMDAVVRKQVIAAVKPIHQRRNHASVASDKTPDVIAEASVPLHPAADQETTHPTDSATGVPGLGNQPHVPEIGIGTNFAKDRWVAPIDRTIGSP